MVEVWVVREWEDDNEVVGVTLKTAMKNKSELYGGRVQRMRAKE